MCDVVCFFGTRAGRPRARQVNLDNAASRFRFAKRRRDLLLEYCVDLVLNEGQFTGRPSQEYVPTPRRSLGDQPDKFLQLLGSRFGCAHRIPMTLAMDASSSSAAPLQNRVLASGRKVLAAND